MLFFGGAGFRAFWVFGVSRVLRVFRRCLGLSVRGFRISMLQALGVSGSRI